MKKLLIGMLCLAFAGTVQAQEVKSDAAVTVAKNPNGPKFQFKEETHDFGKVPEGPFAEHIFEFKNVGKEPLVIQNCSASCGCTSPEWPKEPILPGKKGQIKVRFTTQGRGNQSFAKDVYITSNAISDKERYELHIKGFVTPAPQTGDKAATPAPAAH